MPLFDELLHLQRLDGLLRRKTPGTAQEVATRLGVSRRTLFRLFDELRSFGAEVAYCKKGKRYYYRTPPEAPFLPPPRSEQIILLKKQGAKIWHA
ncbi:MAG: hypothetical protein KIPDCIKN_03754 [Haliscomenobacter sp.]|nr:hypothetical protein [Haliscomenobacter sp.]